MYKGAVTGEGRGPTYHDCYTQTTLIKMAVEEANIAWAIVSASKLAQKSLPVPTPGPNQVLIRITAVALNFRDHLILHHNPAYPLKAAAGLIACSDGAGKIAAAGPSSKWSNRIGTSVIVHISTWLDGDFCDNYRLESSLGGGDVNGTLTRYLVLDDERVLEAPRGLNDAESASLVTAGLTAYNALFEAPGGFAKPAKGVTVLTQGTGGVSCFAIQVRCTFF